MNASVIWISADELPELHTLNSPTYPEMKASDKLLGVREKGSIIIVMCVQDSDSSQPRFQRVESGKIMTDVSITHWSKLPKTPFTEKRALETCS